MIIMMNTNSLTYGLDYARYSSNHTLTSFGRVTGRYEVVSVNCATVFFVRRATIMEKPVARRTKLVAQNGGQIFHDRHCEIKKL